jgi:hypothetical protein
MNKETVKELHKPVTRHFERRKVIANSIDDIWSADLVDMIKLPDGKYKYILTVIDILSKYAWGIPLTNKRSSTVLDAFENIMKSSDRKPNKLWTDSGSEFYSTVFKKFLKENDIIIYSVYNENHSAVVERFNRTLKEAMWRKFDENDNQKWMKMLPELLYEYNNKVHSTIKMTPNEASKDKNEDELSTRMTTANDKKQNPKFKVGDRVRISRIKKHFEKGYTINWSIELFTIHEVRTTEPITYRIIDDNKEIIEGSFYEKELQHSKS